MLIAFLLVLLIVLPTSPALPPIATCWSWGWRALGWAVSGLTRWRSERGYRRHPDMALPRRCQCPKPAWVKQEIIRLKALMPDTGTCRAIADIFNRRFAAKRKVTVGKTYVSDVIRAHRYEIDCLRRDIKNAKPRPVAKNLVWGVDLTGKVTLDGRTQAVLAILEHASRAVLHLEALQSKSSWTLVSRIVDAIQRYGKPHTIRTDNESVFTSAAFRLALHLLGIRHQRTEPGCPWQNGRVERFFRTLKEQLDRLGVQSVAALNTALGEFRFYYNYVRPHQHLAGRTPAEAWSGLNPYLVSVKNEYWFEAWDGLLQGYYLRT
jgi:transposase InsO family protein